MEGVEKFKYLGRPPEKMDYDWTVLQRNINQAWRVWGRLGKILRREGEGPKVVAMVYREVTQVVLLFGMETWVLSSIMDRTVEGTHIRFLRQITGKRAWRKADGIWVTTKAEVVREAADNQLEIS